MIYYALEQQTAALVFLAVIGVPKKARRAMSFRNAHGLSRADFFLVIENEDVDPIPAGLFNLVAQQGATIIRVRRSA